MTYKKHFVAGALALTALLSTAVVASAATSFSNPLTGFTGDSTLPTTQTALATAGFNFASTEAEQTVAFDATGAHFGALAIGDGGRNYMRTVQSDYANTNFVTEVTMVAPDLDAAPYQSGWLGLGGGERALFGWPDWSTQLASIMVVPEKFEGGSGTVRYFTTMYTNNDAPVFANNEMPVLENGTHRLRLSFDWFAKSAQFSIDLNYAGGPFTSDYAAPAIPLLGLFAADGWPTEPSRIFFGGDDGTTFKDFQVTVDGPPIVYGDLNSDSVINSLDWVVFRTNQETDLSALSFKDAYFRGDLNATRTNDHDDFVIFKTLFDGANGVGAFVAMVGAVPEPSALAAIFSAGLFALPVVRRAKHDR
jgi:hypothetical protein